MKQLLLLLSPLLLAACSKSDSTTTETAPVPTPVPVDGLAAYTGNCATCHMVDGSGVPMLQPPLAYSKVVAGDPQTLIRLVLLGPAKVLPPSDGSFTNTMPPFPQLDDATIAAILTQVRHSFGNTSGPITATQVATVRATP